MKLLEFYYAHSIAIHWGVGIWVFFMLVSHTIGAITITPRFLWTRAFTFGPFIFIRNAMVPVQYGKEIRKIPYAWTDQFQQTLNHEYIHFLQKRELFFLFAELWYLIELVVKTLWYRSFKAGYLAISFEREAYGFQNVIGYAGRRNKYSWLPLVYVRMNKKTRENQEKLYRNKSAAINARIKHGVGKAKKVTFDEVKQQVKQK